MSESVRIGGVGKNPAIDRINSLNAADIKKCAVKKMEQLLLESDTAQPGMYAKAVPIDFSKVDWKGRSKEKAEIRKENLYGNSNTRGWMAGAGMSAGANPYRTPTRVGTPDRRNVKEEIPVRHAAAGSIFERTD